MIHNHWLSVAHHDSHRSHLLYFVSWSCVSPHHWHLYDTCHTYSTLWVDHVYPTSLTPIWHRSYLLYFASWSCVSPHHWHLYDTCHTYSTLWVDHVYPHIIDTYMTPVILTLLCELITCIPTSLTPIWHLSYLLYFVSWSHVSPHHWHLYDTRHTYSTLCIPTSLTPIWHMSYLLYFVYPTSLTPIWHLSYLLYFVYLHIIDPIWHLSYLLYFVSWSCVSPHHWHLSYLLYFVSWSCVSPHHWHLYDTCHTVMRAGGLAL